MPLGKVVWRHVEDIVGRNQTRHTYNGRAAVAPQFDGRPQMLQLAEAYLPPLGSMITVGEPIVFSLQERVNAHCVNGWSTAEGLGVWSMGPFAELCFEIEQVAATVELTFSAFIGPSNRVLQLEIMLEGFSGNENPARSLSLVDESERVVAIDLPPRRGTFHVVFRITSPVSPMSLGISNDTRELGIRLRALRVLAYGAVQAFTCHAHKNDASA